MIEAKGFVKNLYTGDTAETDWVCGWSIRDIINGKADFVIKEGVFIPYPNRPKTFFVVDTPYKIVFKAKHMGLDIDGLYTLYAVDYDGGVKFLEVTPLEACEMLEKARE